VSPAILSRLRRDGWRRARVCIDVRGQTVFFAVADAGRGSLSAGAIGGIELDPSLSLGQQIAELARSPLLRGRLVEVAARADEVVHTRIAVPHLRRKEVRAIAERRARENEAPAGPEVRTTFCTSGDGQPGVLWLAQVSSEAVLAEFESWEEWGLPVHRLQSRPLALGNLTRRLPPQAEGGLVAILDREELHGNCVVADRHGWVFSREIPIRFMGERFVRPGAHDVHQVVEVALTPDEPSGLQLVVDPDPFPDVDELSEGAGDPMERTAGQVERLATELRRTFRYVEGDLGAGKITCVYLAGEEWGLGNIAPSLSLALDVPVEVLSDAFDDALEGAPSGAAVAIGMALAPDREGGNLLPTAVLEKRQSERWRHALAAAIVSALFVVGAGATFAGLQGRSLSTRVEQLDREWTSGAARRERAEHVRSSRTRSARALDLLAELDRPQPSWTSLLETLSKVAPGAVHVETLSLRRIGEDWRLALTVRARDHDVASASRSVSSLAQALSASPMLAVDHVERAEAARSGHSGDSSATVRYEIDARLAVIGDGPAPASGESEEGSQRG
jgi:Tfp pilus assembly protein PilN